MMKRVLTAVLALVLVFGFAGCGRGKTNSDYDYLFERDEGDLYVRYFEGGNGAEWLYEITHNFVQETGIGVYLESDNSVTSEIPTLLKNAHPSNGKPSATILNKLPDVVMTQTLKWQGYVNKGYISEIDDVYSYVYEDEDDKTLSDKLIDEAAQFGYMGQTPSSADKHYWVVPWTSPLTGIVYNVDMLKSLGGKWADGYTPKTVTELLELVADLKAAGKTAFAWGGDGTNMGYWNFLFMSLWCSYQGYDESFEDGVAKYGDLKDFYNFVDNAGNPDSGYESFNQAGRKIALQVLRDLIVDEANSTWTNSIKDPVSKTVYEAQEKFAFGEAAMMPNGSWIQNEIDELIDENFHYAMMPVPAVDYAYVSSVASKLGLESKEIHGGLLKDGGFETASTQSPEYAVVNNTEIGDLMFIPENAVHKENAKKFLIYLNKQENVMKATESMSIARPFDYSPSEAEGLTDFTKSVFSVYENPDALQIVRTSTSNIFMYAGIKEWAENNEADILLQLYGKTANELVTTVYNNAMDNFDKWKELAEV